METNNSALIRLLCCARGGKPKTDGDVAAIKTKTEDQRNDYAATPRRRNAQVVAAKLSTSADSAKTYVKFESAMLNLCAAYYK
jgi:hypothetical protein